MTIKELIERLSAMPQEAVVVINMYSECRELDDDEPTVENMVLHNGTWMREGFDRYRNESDRAKNPAVKVCHFPGN